MIKNVLDLDEYRKLVVVNDFVFPLYKICTDNCKSMLKNDFFNILNFENDKTVFGINFYLLSYHLKINEKLNTGAITSIINKMNSSDFDKARKYFLEYKQNSDNSSVNEIENDDLDTILEVIEKRKIQVIEK